MSVTFEDIAKAWQLWSDWMIGQKVRKQTVRDIDLHASLDCSTGQWRIFILAILYRPDDESGLIDDENVDPFDTMPFASFDPESLEDLLFVLNGGRILRDHEWVLADEVEPATTDE